MTILGAVHVVAMALLAGDVLSIDGFQYADAEAARAAWTPWPASTPLTVQEVPSGQALSFPAAFAADREVPRVYVDREVQLDLSAPGEFRLMVSVDPPAAAQQVSLYFRSGRGWYGAGRGLPGGGLQEIAFSKAAFRPEGTPAGWNRVDGVRIAVWRGQARDARVRIGGLSAVTREVALVVPAADRRDEGEYRAAVQAAERMARMFDALGLGADAVEDADLVRGGLRARRVVVLPHNPGLPSKAVEALADFVREGGKVLACYQLPGELAAELGFASPRYVSQDRTGHFAEVRFEAEDIAGLPDAFHQASWNITAAEPADHGARVIGHWYDGAGEPTGLPAMLLSDRGAFFSHIVLGDDQDRKRQMLAAVLGHLDGELWLRMAGAALDEAERVGHFDCWDALADFVAAAEVSEAEAALAAARERLAEARARFDAGRHAEVAALAREAREAAVEAYLRAHPSPAIEGRAVWNHSGTGAYPGDWDRSARELAEAGVNMILPNMLWGGLAHYESDLLPRSAAFREHGDQVAQCVEAARRHGLSVHVWKVNYNLSNAPREFVERMHREGRTQVSVSGEQHRWLCPSHPENQRLELESMLEVARKYDVDGLHFDYIRYPGAEYCFCDGCRERFEADSGEKVENWPADCHRGPRAEEYTDWRCDQITALVAAVHREAKALRPDLAVSAAVFPSYPSSRRSVLQDWALWVEAGYLDFLCPMDYTDSDASFEGLVRNQLELVGGRIPVYPGIGATATGIRLSADRVAGQVYHARRLGADGFTIFNYQPDTARTIIPVLGLGPGSRPATPPHAQ